jgi:hypothetical protein
VIDGSYFNDRLVLKAAISLSSIFRGMEMPAFKAPPGKNVGYDVQNGNLWRVRIPAAESLDVVLIDGSDLDVQSNNPGIIRTPLSENKQGTARTFRLVGTTVGTTMIEARRNGAVVTYLQVQVTPKGLAAKDLLEFDLDPDSPPGQIRFHVSDPKENARYIDKVVTAVGYSIYLGGYHVYCQGLDLPILVPDNMVDFTWHPPKMRRPPCSTVARTR